VSFFEKQGELQSPLLLPVAFCFGVTLPYLAYLAYLQQLPIHPPQDHFAVLCRLWTPRRFVPARFPDGGR
ncbi:MAG: hypothetical protein K0U36_03415, partial [Alphaproteobacteria bacterium]|nr:hypothetical protein [Alphaproteobacteria bacterium]